MPSYPFDIVGYAYKADLYCPDCILDLCSEGEEYDPRAGTEENLDRYAERLGIDREDERSFDSDVFPKVVFRDQLEGSERCSCGEQLG